MPSVADPAPAVYFDPQRLQLARSLRRHVEVIAAAAEANRRHHRTRPRTRGDHARSFFDDPDRFALALMAAIRLGDDHSLIRFGSGRSDWAAAKHAAALAAPGRGQRVSYAHSFDGHTTSARASFGAGGDRHDTASRRLHRKRRELAGLPAEWVAFSGTLLALLNAPTRGATRRHVRALLGRLGWRRRQ